MQKQTNKKTYSLKCENYLHDENSKPQAPEGEFKNKTQQLKVQTLKQFYEAILKESLQARGPGRRFLQHRDYLVQSNFQKTSNHCFSSTSVFMQRLSRSRFFRPSIPTEHHLARLDQSNPASPPSPHTFGFVSLVRHSFHLLCTLQCFPLCASHWRTQR